MQKSDGGAKVTEKFTVAYKMPKMFAPFKFYKNIQHNGRTRRLYVKRASKSQNPILYLYVRSLGMITYKKFLQSKARFY